MNIYDIEVTTVDGMREKMGAYRGKTLLVVNVASRCGFTSQYEGLQSLFERYRDKGFVVLGFPCNQFGHQEPADEAEIRRFCSLTYNVTFPLFSKIMERRRRASAFQASQVRQEGAFRNRSDQVEFYQISCRAGWRRSQTLCPQRHA